MPTYFEARCATYKIEEYINASLKGGYANSLPALITTTTLGQACDEEIMNLPVHWKFSIGNAFQLSLERLRSNSGYESRLILQLEASIFTYL